MSVTDEMCDNSIFVALGGARLWTDNRKNIHAFVPKQGDVLVLPLGLQTKDTTVGYREILEDNVLIEHEVVLRLEEHTNEEPPFLLLRVHFQCEANMAAESVLRAIAKHADPPLETPGTIMRFRYLVRPSEGKEG